MVLPLLVNCKTFDQTKLVIPPLGLIEAVLPVVKSLVATVEPEPKNVFPPPIVKVTTNDEAVNDNAVGPKFFT